MSYEGLGSDMRRNGNFPNANVLWYSTSRLKPLRPHTEWNWRYLTHLSQKCVTSSQELKCSCGDKHSCRLSLLQQMERGQGGCWIASSGAVQPKGEGPVTHFCSRNGPTYALYRTRVIESTCSRGPFSQDRLLLHRSVPVRQADQKAVAGNSQTKDGVGHAYAPSKQDGAPLFIPANQSPQTPCRGLCRDDFWRHPLTGEAPIQALFRNNILVIAGYSSTF